MTIKKAAVLGWPIQHSKSPIIHEYWLNQHGIAGSYEAIAVQPEDLIERVKTLASDGYSGFNLTIPHKQAIIPLLDFVRTDAEKIGAVNTVVIHPDGKLEGRNTDAYGFMTNIKENVTGFDSGAGAAVIIGAGGAARAVLYALMTEGVKRIYIVNRTYARARVLAEMGGDHVTAHPWDALPDLLVDAALLVNTTSLGMKGQPSLDIDLTPMRGGIVNDIVYNPLETELLKQAKAKNLQTVGGIGMLLHQARPAFEAWFGIRPDVDDTLVQKVLA